MEDHQTACRLLVTGAFTRNNMRNYETDPPADMYSRSGGNLSCDASWLQGFPAQTGQSRNVYVDIRAVLKDKREMLACHKSQKEWLDKSQGIDAYLNLMESFAHEAGTMSGCFTLC